ncbi:MAG: response regulator transcription factor [Candidatus Eremiobacteraeota bacterium]|nr:response regulator transcription factor [Candidatus Eremiobacteraeota bacterium]
MIELPRPRLNALFENAAQRQVTLVVAPAGSGKSIAVRRYLTTVARPHRLFDLRNPGRGLEEWLDGEGQTFEGLVAIDALESADANSVPLGPLLAAVAHSGHRIRWMLVSRGAARLPIGSWLGYGVTGPPIAMADLRFTADELAALASASGAPAQQRDLDEIMQFTRGWAIASAFAIRALARVEMRSVRTETSEMMQRFLGEHLDEALDEAERELLVFSSLLPAIDVPLLEQAGFERARQLLERIQMQTSLVRELPDGRFECDPLLIDCLHRRVQSLERPKRERMYAVLAATLEASHDAAGALDAYAAAGRRADVLRILESDGFDLIDRARTEAVTRAIEALDERIRRSHPHVLALRGVLHAAKGRPARAESLLRRSLVCADSDRNMSAIASLRLAVLIANRGDEVSDLLGPIANDSLHSPNHRAEAFSLMAAQRALAGDADAATAAVAHVDDLLPQIDHDVTRAKVLQRIGVTAVNTGNVSRARAALEEAADLARELELHSVASRACSTLFNLMRHHYDDSAHQEALADLAVESAEKSGDAFDLHSALAQKLSSAARLGHVEISVIVEERLNAIPIRDDRRKHYVVPLRALRLAREGKFSEAHRLLGPSRSHLYYPFDRILYTGQCALFLAMDDRREPSNALTVEVANMIETSEDGGIFSRRQAAMALLYCSVAEAVKGRMTFAGRLARKIKATDLVTSAAKEIASKFVAGIEHDGHCRAGDLSDEFTTLRSVGYADATDILGAVNEALSQRERRRERLSAAEVSVLRMLSEGLGTKEIASRTGRSPYTVRVHIANATAKLRCHGRMEAVAVARRLALIP